MWKSGVQPRYGRNICSPGLRRELSRTANDEGVSPWVRMNKRKPSEQK
jgi:hypothetical protein